MSRFVDWIDEWHRARDELAAIFAFRTRPLRTWQFSATSFFAYERAVSNFRFSEFSRAAPKNPLAFTAPLTVDRSHDRTGVRGLCRS